MINCRQMLVSLNIAHYNNIISPLIINSILFFFFFLFFCRWFITSYISHDDNKKLVRMNYTHKWVSIYKFGHELPHINVHVMSIFNRRQRSPVAPVAGTFCLRPAPWTVRRSCEWTTFKEPGVVKLWIYELFVFNKISERHVQWTGPSIMY